jgi:hypothetical protein
MPRASHSVAREANTSAGVLSGCGDCNDDTLFIARALVRCNEVNPMISRRMIVCWVVVHVDAYCGRRIMGNVFLPGKCQNDIIFLLLLVRKRHLEATSDDVTSITIIHQRNSIYLIRLSLERVEWRLNQKKNTERRYRCLSKGKYVCQSQLLVFLALVGDKCLFFTDMGITAPP